MYVCMCIYILYMYVYVLLLWSVGASCFLIKPDSIKSRKGSVPNSCAWVYDFPDGSVCSKGKSHANARTA